MYHPIGVYNMYFTKLSYSVLLMAYFFLHSTEWQLSDVGYEDAEKNESCTIIANEKLQSAQLKFDDKFVIGLSCIENNIMISLTATLSDTTIITCCKSKTNGTITCSLHKIRDTESSLKFRSSYIYGTEAKSIFDGLRSYYEQLR